MTTQHSTARDSSVVFNLRELMQLEAERVQAEHDRRVALARDEAERQRRAQEATRVAEAQHRAELARIRIEAEVKARAETERQGLLLRIRMAAEAEAGAPMRGTATLDIDKEPAKRGVHSRARTLFVCLLAAALGGAAAAASISTPTPVAPAREAAILARQSRELAELRKQLAARSDGAAQRAVESPSTPPQRARPSAAAQPSTTRPRPKRSAMAMRPSTTELDTVGDGDDPIEGLR